MGDSGFVVKHPVYLCQLKMKKGIKIAASCLKASSLRNNRKKENDVTSTTFCQHFPWIVFQFLYRIFQISYCSLVSSM